MSEETIKMLNVINDKVKKCMKDNNVNTLLAIPLGGDGSFGFLTNKMLNEIIQLQQENQQLKEQLKLVESLTCFNMPNNTPMVCMFKADYERNKYEYETIDKYKSVLDEIRELMDKYNLGRYDYSIPAFEIQEILDKVKENDNKE